MAEGMGRQTLRRISDRQYTEVFGPLLTLTAGDHDTYTGPVWS